VAALLEAHCTSCHAASTLKIPPLLETYEQLVAATKKDPSKTNAERSLETMLGGAKPMPPDALLPEEVIAPFAAWVAAGAPAGECGNTAAASSGGGADGGGGQAGAGPSAPQCTSQSYWTNGEMGAKDMTPGMACVACHAAKKKGPLFSVAGTVYPTAHEPDNCYGALDAVVEIVDKNGQTLLLKSDAGGNFFYKPKTGLPPLVFPLETRVLHGGKALPMLGPITEADGDCNRCHTQDGLEGAPGRIRLP
jgi:hypothetical protein